MTSTAKFTRPTPALLCLAMASLILIGAIFGFFYAWVCSTMWGLDAADPMVAISAMQAMNASVRNAVFAPAFFGTPLVIFVAGMVAWAEARRVSARSFFAAGAIYLIGGLILTMAINVPMNEALAVVVVPEDSAVAAQIWADYSADWQVWNIARTIASGISLALVGRALMHFREINA